MIGVTGATGGMGSRVARRLAGEPLRLIVRDAARVPAVGAEVHEASSYGARDEMRAALKGVDTLFLIPAKESADRLQQHFTAVDAAVDAGVKRIVYLSFIRRGDSSFTLGREHFATEDHIRESGLAWVFPRMNLYMDFIPNMIGSDGVIRGPAGDGRFAAVLRDDIADAVAAILASPEPHDGEAYDLTGPEAFTLTEAAEETSRAWGRTDRVRERDARGGPRLTVRLRSARLGGRGLDQLVRGDCERRAVGRERRRGAIGRPPTDVAARLAPYFRQIAAKRVLLVPTW
jgi:NAD(P)H dehydrogenase (quinone)